MSVAPDTTRPIMKRAAPDDEVTVRYALPASLVTQAPHGHVLATCMDGAIRIPKSLGKLLPKAAKANVIVFEARIRRDVSEVIGSLIGEVVRLTRELEATKARD